MELMRPGVQRHTLRPARCSLTRNVVHDGHAEGRALDGLAAAGTSFGVVLGEDGRDPDAHDPAAAELGGGHSSIVAEGSPDRCSWLPSGVTGQPDWTLEAIGTAEWTGVPLVEWMSGAGVRPEAAELVFTGHDEGIQKGVRHFYLRSLTVEEAHTHPGPCPHDTTRASRVSQSRSHGWRRAVTLFGRAWSAEAPVVRVEVAVDGSWADAKLGAEVGPSPGGAGRSHGTRHWANTP